MRIPAFLIVVALAACTKHNPDTCCTTQAQCDSLGFDQIYACDSARVCDPTGLCVAPQCTTSADCTSPDTPICEGQLCIAKCTSDDECVGIAGKPYCASDGVCVACKDDSQCAADAPVCDAATHSCRGCIEDAECSGGLCLEADGVCIATTQAVFIAASGADSGECTAAAPCLSFGYALNKVDSIRNVIRLVGGLLQLGTATITIDRPVYVDGSGTTLQGPLAGPAISVASFVTPVTLSHISLAVTSNQALSVASGASLRLYDATITRGVADNGGTVIISKSKFINSDLSAGAVNCMNGTVSIDTTEFDTSDFSTQNCQLALKRSRFDESGGRCFLASGGTVVIENNLFVVSYELADCGYVAGTAPGSTVRFNTFVNTSGVASDGTALNCDNTAIVTSNIFAYGSMHPHSPNSPCMTRYSLYDTVALPATTAGTGNVIGDRSTFFASDATHDFHLAPASPAIGAGEAGLVDTDYDGLVRPMPTGSKPDVGAFEAP